MVGGSRQTLARAKQNIQSITDSSQDSLLGVLITAVSEMIEKYCRRRFVGNRKAGARVEAGAGVNDRDFIACPGRNL